MLRNEACLPAIDANSAEAIGAMTLRVHQLWNFLKEASKLLEFAAEFEAKGRCRAWKGSTMITFRRILAYLFPRKLQGSLVAGWSYRNGQRVLYRLTN